MLLQILPVLAYLAIAAVILWIAAVPKVPTSWLPPALLGLAFTGFTLLTVAREGVWQFWINHTTSLAGNQVWFDLLIAVAISFALMLPRARAVGMAIWPWTLAVLATASVALLPMLARILWLERHARGPER